MMNARVEMNERMMEQVVGGYYVGQHVEVRASFCGFFEHTDGGTITEIITDAKTGKQLCYVKFDHWYAGDDDWFTTDYFE